MNSKLLTILLCAIILFSQVSADAAADKIAVCSNADSNLAATTVRITQIHVAAHAKTTQDNFNAHQLANEIKTEANRVALINFVASTNQFGTYLPADFTLANCYASADWTAANALADMIFTDVNVISDAVLIVYRNDAAAQHVAARNLYRANIGGDVSLAPATVKAFNDCIGVNYSATATAVNAWDLTSTNANTLKHITRAAVYAAMSFAKHAADDVLFAGRPADGSAGCTAAYVAADADFVSGNAAADAAWVLSNSDAAAAMTLANNNYASDATATAADLVAYSG